MSSRTVPKTDLLSPNFFWWATGIEDTFITAPHPRTGRTLDEYELTEHYQRWRKDFELMSQLGVRIARYGVPWHRIQPTKRRWDWKFADATLERLLELGIDPIVDLVHYGLPPWIDGAYLNADYPQYVAEYAARLAERFRGRIRYYTPLNEPRITAWYCGRIGWWPPFLHGWRGFTAVTMSICRGMVETIRALRGVDPKIVPVHVDACDLYLSEDPSLQPEAAHRQALVFIYADLITGRVDRRHLLYRWLLDHGATLSQLEWFQANPVELPVIGMNMYPMFSQKYLIRGPGGLRAHMKYASGKVVEEIAKLYWRRYGRPLIISETASVGSVARRRAWLEDSVAAVRRLRQRGVPLVGYTWWPMFALVTWAHRQGTHPASYYLKQMGLWDLTDELDRVETPLVEEYAALARAGHSSAGVLAAIKGRRAA